MAEKKKRNDWEKKPRGISPGRFYDVLKSGAITPVCLFEGPEEWLKRRAMEDVRAALLPEGLEQLNDTTMDEASIRDVIAAAATVPFMSERRVIEVRDWAPLKSAAARDETREVERLKEWLADVPKTAAVVFTLHGLADSRKKAFQTLRASPACTVVEFESLSGPALYDWAEEYVKPRGKKIRQAAVDEMTKRAGVDLTRLAQELDKLVDAIGRRGEISAADVQALVAETAESKIFDVTAALLKGDPGKAAQITRSIILNGENHVHVLALLTYQMRMLAHTRYAIDAGDRVGDLIQNLGVKDWQAKLLMSQCRTLPADTFKSLFEACTETDYAIKSGRINAAAGLDAMEIKISAAAGAKGGTGRR